MAFDALRVAPMEFAPGCWWAPWTPNGVKASLDEAEQPVGSVEQVIDVIELLMVEGVKHGPEMKQQAHTKSSHATSSASSGPPQPPPLQRPFTRVVRHRAHFPRALAKRSSGSDIPEQHCKVIAKLPSSEFQKICRDLKEFGEAMSLSASEEGIRFSVQGDIGTGNVMLKPREAEKPEDKVSLTVHEPVTATFALRYLVIFAKAAPLCGVVELGLGPDAPLLGEYDLEEVGGGHMQFYLAPKIDDR